MNEIPMSTSFAVASPNIVHETFDDEVVIVSLDSGSYYSMGEAGMLCWQQILAGCSVEKIVESLLSAYEADAHSVRDSVLALINEMETEQLIVRLDRPAENEAPASALPSERKAFQPPVLFRYEDMKQLLVIDPVHMVSDDGWPQIRRMDDAGQ